MYQPNKKLLSKYAEVLVKFAVNSGKGVKRGDVVQCLVPDVAKPMLRSLHQVILKEGAHPLVRLMPTGLDKTFFDLANEEQLTFFPKNYLRSRINLIDHSIGIIAEHDLFELRETDPKKIVKAAESKKKVREWMSNKEYAGKFTWTLALYGTPAMAEEVGLSLKDYWRQIINACFLDYDNPIKKWKTIFTEQERIKKSLGMLSIKKLHVKARAIDLWLSFGEKRKWVGGNGRNIPSFEIFTSPDWRGTQGYISFNQPLYRYGNLVEGIRLEFNKGRVIKATATKGNRLLQEMLTRENADKLGEFSLTDSRFSRISRFMANTLYDENRGGRYGNTHIALGMAYKDSYVGNPSKVKRSEWKKMGFNNSGEHTDLISTEDRIVTAYLTSGKKKVIYKDGKFVV